MVLALNQLFNEFNCHIDTIHSLFINYLNYFLTIKIIISFVKLIWIFMEFDWKCFYQLIKFYFAYSFTITFASSNPILFFPFFFKKNYLNFIEKILKWRRLWIFICIFPNNTHKILNHMALIFFIVISIIIRFGIILTKITIDPHFDITFFINANLVFSDKEIKHIFIQFLITFKCWKKHI